MELRPATIEDARLLFDWRNDPVTRAQSHSTEEIDFQSHLRWLERSLSNPARKLYVAEQDSRPVGTVRADTANGVTELSWTVAPEARGQRVGTRLVQALVAILDGPLRAEIKKDNVASCKIALAAGLVFDHEEDGVMHFTD